MAFRQLYYTSCQQGLLGYDGFQFNAVTSGISPEVMREVEELTAYQPPRSMPVDPEPDQLADFPVAFSHKPNLAGTSLTARVVYTGKDYSHRPGNYFAHALIAESAADFGTLMPVELWDAPFWQRQPVPTTELPLLTGPSTPGVITRELVASYFDDRDPLMLSALVSAAGEAIADDQSVLLVSADSAALAIWIAAVSYLLGEGLARRLAFTTYSHRPAERRYHLIGVLPEQAADPSVQAIRSFDLAAGRPPDRPTHALATLLVRAGIGGVRPLWRTAATLRTSASDDFDSWYPVVCAAASLHGVDLNRGDQAAIVSWLAAADPLPTAAGQVIVSLLRRAPADLPDQWLTELHEAAGRASKAGAGAGAADGSGTAATMATLETAIVDRAFERIAIAERPPDPIRLGEGPARDHAVSRCADLLRRPPPPAQVAELLRWSESAGITVSDESLRRYGEQALAADADPDDLAAVLAKRPHVIEGFLSRIADDPATARRVFATTDVIEPLILEGYPRLQEPWLLGARIRGTLAALDVFDKITWLRSKTGETIDAELLDALWPDGCPVADLRRLLPFAENAGPGSVRDWFADAIATALASQSSADRLALAKSLDRCPAVRGWLPPKVASVAVGLSALSAVRRVAAGGTAAGRAATGEVSVFASVYETYPHTTSQLQKLLRDETKTLLCEAEDMDLALDGCPPVIRAEFCQLVDQRLRAAGRQGLPRFARARAERGLAARVFFAMLRLRETGAESAAADLDQALEPVLDWPRSRRRDLRADLGEHADAFDDWLNRKGRDA